MSNITIGLLGFGNVGSAFVSLIENRRDAIAKRTGVELNIGAIAVRDVTKHQNKVADPGLLTNDPQAVVADPSIDLVVELIGGLEPALELVSLALKAGKPVVTGNKELLASHGPELYSLAATAGVDLLFEAAVAGGIPLVRPLRESLAGEDVTRVMGIINGTTNYILTKMTQEGADYTEALSDAQELGYAEADPTADVEGYDAGAKAAIIASIVFGVQVSASDVDLEGITKVTASDIDTARRLGYVIKALGVIERHGEEISVQVYPAMVPATHPLASVNDSFNAVFIEGVAVGELMFSGRGAGGDPTASAVLGDVIDAAVNKAKGDSAGLIIDEPARLRSPELLSSRYYVTLVVSDRPGVLAQVASVFGEHGVSIQTMEQHGTGEGADICFILHEAPHASVMSTLADLEGLDAVSGIGSVMRLIGES